MKPHVPHVDGQDTLIVGSSRTVPELLAQLQRHGDAGETGRPRIRGIVLWNEPASVADHRFGPAVPLLGSLNGRPDRVIDLVRSLGGEKPAIALISLPATMSGAIQRLRTTFRRLGIADRFVPTFEDLVNGVGPRTQLEIDPVDLIGRSPHALDEALIAEAITGRRVLITGAGGSIGSELTRLVARFDPAALLLMERSENALFEIDRQIARRHPTLDRRAWLHDVTDVPRTRAYCIAARPQVIFHAAAHKHVPLMEDHPALAVINNVFGTRAIADAAVETACERFVMISTDKAVRPTSVMGATKRIAELYVQYLNGVSDTRFSIVRFGNVLGSAGSVLPIWLDQIREGGPVTVTDPQMTRFFMTIPEAAGLVLSAASLEDEITLNQGGEVRLLDMGEPVRVLDLACRVIEAHGLEPDIRSIGSTGRPEGTAELEPQGGREVTSIPIHFSGIRPGEKLHEELAYDREQLLPTSHPGIHVWKTDPPYAELIADLMGILHEAVDAALERPDFTTAQRIVDALRFLVPEANLRRLEVASRRTLEVPVTTRGPARRPSAGPATSRSVTPLTPPPATNRSAPAA